MALLCLGYANIMRKHQQQHPAGLPLLQVMVRALLASFRDLNSSDSPDEHIRSFAQRRTLEKALPILVYCSLSNSALEPLRDFMRAVKASSATASEKTLYGVFNKICPWARQLSPAILGGGKEREVGGKAPQKGERGGKVKKEEEFAWDRNIPHLDIHATRINRSGAFWSYLLDVLTNGWAFIISSRFLLPFARAVTEEEEEVEKEFIITTLLPKILSLLTPRNMDDL